MKTLLRCVLWVAPLCLVAACGAPDSIDEGMTQDELSIAANGVSQSSVGHNFMGGLEIFARGSDGKIWHAWQNSDLSWVPWESMGGGGVPADAQPAVGLNPDGQRLEVFVRGTDGALWHNHQLPTTHAWSGWESLGGSFTGSPAVALNSSNHLEVFVRDTTGQVSHIWETPGSGSPTGWSDWSSLGGGFPADASPTVAVNSDGSRLEVFIRGSDGQLYHQWQESGSYAWSGFAALSGAMMTGTPSVTLNFQNLLEVFVRNTNGQVSHIRQMPGAPGAAVTWSAWDSLSATLPANASPVALRGTDMRIEVFARGSDSNLWHRWQEPGTYGWYPSWMQVGSNIRGDSALAVNQLGGLEVFSLSANATLEHAWQSSAGSTWTGENLLLPQEPPSVPPSQPAPGTPPPATPPSAENPATFFITQNRTVWNPEGSINGNCGPTSLAMAALAYNRLPSGTSRSRPEQLIETVRIDMTGYDNIHAATNCAQVATGASKLGIPNYKVYDVAALNAALANGKMAVVLGNSGAYTPHPGGHFILVVRRSGSGYIINDPAYTGRPGVYISASQMANYFWEAVVVY